MVMKLLNGKELADYIKERQAKQVRGLRQAAAVFPRLAIIKTGDNPVIDTYVRLKKEYGEDILIDTDIHSVQMDEIANLIQALNNDSMVHGIIVQLPLTDPSMTDEVVGAISPSKDVDGMGPNASYTSATALAIDWMLAGYNVELKNKKIAIVGKGRLVGEPLLKLWQSAGLDVTAYDDAVQDLAGELKQAQIIITATGVPGLITSQMIQPGVVVVDAGTATENGKLVGDLAEDVRERNDLTVTPKIGGVGPLTIAALFDHVIQAARATVELAE